MDGLIRCPPLTLELEENVKMDIAREIRCEGVVWIQLAQDRVQWLSVYEDGDESSGSIKGTEFIDQLNHC
jgi:hypothetical protein